MQFKGTPKYPINVLDQAISRDGGFWNALTSLDWTTYLETLPAHKLDIALDLEADRMVNSSFDPQETNWNARWSFRNAKATRTSRSSV